MTTPPSIRALYVHVPFCRTLCGYCDFYSVVAEPGRLESLVVALLDELDRAARALQPRFDTIFVGGGTPTVLPEPLLRRLLDACARLAAPAADREFTVEANPATVSPGTAAVLAAASVNRVSLGAQSFQPRELLTLQRTHTPEQVAQTVAVCRAAGLDHLSLDLIFGIPGQTLGSWRDSLRQVVELSPEHLSCYGLTYEPGTPLHDQRDAGQVQPVDPDLEADMYEQAIDDLAAAGYEQYEISNFARPGAACRHNLVYWHNEPYLGIGPAAAGYVDGVRYQNVADVDAYTQAVSAGRSPRDNEERLDAASQAGETAMLALRLCAGLDRRRFTERFGRDPVDHFRKAVDRHAADGLLEVTPEAVHLTRRGRLIADRVIADFL
ncbi:MAG: radical SAM family heme chaperone HemW [Phycisphaerae bacterium]|jgi:oxygen-independent coproporphyrinogen-3 oxidase